MGNFKEGFCFRLTTKTNAVWDICADSLKEKERWMDMIESVMPKIFANAYSGDDSLLISNSIPTPF